MRNEFTAVIERDGDWYIAYCPEVPGANGQAISKQEALNSLRDAIALILEDRREEGLRGVPTDAEREVVVVESNARRDCQICRPRMSILPPELDLRKSFVSVRDRCRHAESSDDLVNPCVIRSGRE